MSQERKTITPTYALLFSVLWPNMMGANNNLHNYVAKSSVIIGKFKIKRILSTDTARKISYLCDELVIVELQTFAEFSKGYFSHLR